MSASLFFFFPLPLSHKQIDCRELGFWDKQFLPQEIHTACPTLLATLPFTCVAQKPGIGDSAHHNRICSVGSTWFACEWSILELM
jgi:hypothetical protein